MASCSRATSGAKDKEAGIPMIKIESNLFVDSHNAMFVETARTPEAVRVLTRISYRWRLTDREGVEHTWRSIKHPLDVDLVAYVAPVIEWHFTGGAFDGQTLYRMYVDSELFPQHGRTLKRIMEEELIALQVPVSVFGEYRPLGSSLDLGQIDTKRVGPRFDQMLDGSEFPEFRPTDLIEKE
jgi:hypothetical protein